MPYQPDPQQVRKIAARIIQSEIESIRDLGAMDVGEMCADEIEALHEVSPGSRAADNATDALIDAVRKEICAATEVAVNARETAERAPVETGRLEVVLRKVGTR